MCNSSGLPEPSYTIIDNDNKIVSNKSVNSTYIIDDVQLSDAGTYKCIALNKLGAGPASDNLTVGKIRSHFVSPTLSLCEKLRGETRKRKFSSVQVFQYDVRIIKNNPPFWVANIFYSTDYYTHSCGPLL